MLLFGVFRGIMKVLLMSVSVGCWASIPSFVYLMTLEGEAEWLVAGRGTLGGVDFTQSNIAV